MSPHSEHAADFAFWGRSTFQSYNNIVALRQLAGAGMGVKLGDRQVWLPIIWSAPDPIYGTAIAHTEAKIDRRAIELDPIDLHQLQQTV